MKKLSSLIIAVVLVSVFSTARVQAGSSSWEKALIVGTLLHVLLPPPVVVVNPPPVVMHSPVVVSPPVVVHRPRVVVSPSVVVCPSFRVIRPVAPVVVYPSRHDHYRGDFRGDGRHYSSPRGHEYRRDSSNHRGYQQGPGASHGRRR